MNTKAIITQLKKRQEAVGRERDKLRDFISDMDDLRETCESAYDDIQRAIDALSELV